MKKVDEILRAIKAGNVEKLSQLRQELRNEMWMDSIPDGDTPFHVKVNGKVILRFVPASQLTDEQLEKYKKIIGINNEELSNEPESKN